MSYGHTWIADRDTTLALLPIGYADGVFRTLSGRIDVLINGRLRPQRRPHLHGPVRRRPRSRRRSTSPRVTTRSCSARARDGEPTAQDWADLLGTINYEVVTSPRGRVVRTYRGQRRAKPLSDKDPAAARRRSNAWLAGAAGLTAVGTAAGVSVARSLRRRVSADDPYEDEDFELLDADRSSVVTTPDGVDLAVREVGPAGRPADGGVRARLLSSDGRLPLSARPAG